MILHELVIEMKLLERRLMLYEEKYGVLSEDFFAALTAGKLNRYDEYDETRSDFSRWKGIYETWLRRKKAYPSVREADLPADSRRNGLSNAENLTSPLSDKAKTSIPSV